MFVPFLHTLVVDTTNYNDKGSIATSAATGRVRGMPLTRDSKYEMFEYACAEGNYATPNMLAAGRAAERASTKLTRAPGLQPPAPRSRTAR